ncbi:hypothetical protein [Andreprevotia chitinilytica]|uniref:hypothetical protein n=1 Tax=Andreprevotia chitinilytica TaxID=396808 RepID=UPI00054D216E|nr:hypothetical protein [Andreprevotia chitinilytica]
MHIVVLSFLFASAFATAAGDADLDALSLADQPAPAAEKSSDWRFFVEGAAGYAPLRNGGATRSERLSGSVQLDTRLSPDWRLVFADRLDQNWQASFDNGRATNTIKDAYLSWQASPERSLDLGRINTHYGVAMGYNPTDFFRANAIRVRVSEDPGSLRENRQGSVMLRGQQLWDGGALTLLYSPKLAEHANDGSFNPDWGATNGTDRWLASLSTRLSDDFNPEWLVYREAGHEPQLGANITVLLSAATVAHLEWSGGRASSLLGQLNGIDDVAWRNRWALGATYTTSFKLSLTAEYDYNGAGLDSAGWQALQVGAPQQYGLYRGGVQRLQEQPTRSEWFFRAAWQDALITHLDLTAMLRRNGEDASRMHWFEARYHWDKTDVALQWQLNQGDAGSEYGAASQRQIWQAVLTRYF